MHESKPYKHSCVESFRQSLGFLERVPSKVVDEISRRSGSCPVHCRKNTTPKQVTVVQFSLHVYDVYKKWPAHLSVVI